MSVPQSTVSNQKWATPWPLIQEIAKLGYPIKFDMTSRNASETAPGLSVGAQVDGLQETWPKWTFYNPPFKQIAWWVAKAVKEWKVGNTPSVGVAPANIETKWAGELLQNEATLLVLSPRVQFTGGKGTSAPHATMLMILGGDSQYGDWGIFRHEWHPPKKASRVKPSLEGREYERAYSTAM